MEQYINKASVMEEIERKIKNIDYEGLSDRNIGQEQSLYHILSFINTLEVKEMNEEPVSEYLEEAAFDYAETCKYDGGEKLLCVEHFKAGAQWQKQKNAIEVKEVDLEKEVEDWVKTGPHTSYPWCTIPDAIRITAEHFFELGINAKGG